MNNKTIYYRNKVGHGLYTYVLKPVFFLNDPEFVHDRMMGVGKILGKTKVSRKLVSGLFNYRHPMLEQKILGIDFKNPIGLSAGFDKNAELTDILPSVGFGFAEVGSITGNPCTGNPKPRLWRLKRSKSLVVYYGLKNDGCEAIAHRLKGKHFSIPIGMSVAMTNCIDNLNIKKAIFDYAKALRIMEKTGDYSTVNISCPNTHGGQPFIEPHKLDYLLDILDEIPTTKPVFVKLSPDMSPRELDKILDVLKKHRVHGIICTNLTKKRDNPKILDKHVPSHGGLSGKVVQELSDRMLAYIYRREGKRFVLVGCGGVFNAADAYKKIRLGASLIQMITGMIFEGPQVISEINRGLVDLLKRDGFANIHDAIGVDNKL
jgi:dihydroorotate dehydrogenase